MGELLVRGKNCITTIPQLCLRLDKENSSTNHLPHAMSLLSSRVEICGKITGVLAIAKNDQEENSEEKKEHKT